MVSVSPSSFHPPIKSLHAFHVPNPSFPLSFCHPISIWWWSLHIPDDSWCKMVCCLRTATDKLSILHTHCMSIWEVSHNCYMVFCQQQDWTVSHGCILKLSCLEPRRLRKMYRASDCGTAGTNSGEQHDELQLPQQLFLNQWSQA